MNWMTPSVLGTLVSLSTAIDAWAQSSEYFSGLYVGVEGGAISYDTQITFDGVDDPAGRGGAGYGVFVGYNHTSSKILVGAELSFVFAATPGPYTFDPAAVGFAELDLRRGVSFGFDALAGYLLTDRMLLNAHVGFSANKQSVLIDGLPLDQFAGGAGAETFGAVQFGVGLEVAVHHALGIRVSFERLAGHDLSAVDFGTIPSDAALTRFDVEPSQQQFFVGLTFRFR